MQKERNKLVVPGAQKAIDQMRYEIANEFDVPFGKAKTSRQAGQVTRRLVGEAEEKLQYSDYSPNKDNKG